MLSRHGAQHCQVPPRRRGTRRRRLQWLATLVVAIALTMSPIAAVAVDDSARPLGAVRQALDEVRRQGAELELRMQATQQRIAEHYARQAEIEDELQLLERQLSHHTREAIIVEARVNSRLRQTYMRGSAVDPVAIFLSSDDPSAGLMRAATIRWLVAGDNVKVDDLSAIRSSAAASRTLLQARVAELEQTTAELERLTTILEEDLARSQRLESSLDAQVRTELERIREQERQARLQVAAAPVPQQPVTAPSAAPTSSSAAVCPIDQPHSFIDSWGHPRSGGRRHRGTDLMAPHGLPLRAITDGVWEHQRPGRSAGLWGVLRGDDGSSYRYLHLSAHTAANGARVQAGDEVGRNGATGNASTPHLHFEVHPGGGSAINPYPMLRSLCG